MKNLHRISGLLIFLMAAVCLLPAALDAEVVSREGPYITVRETGQATLGEGTKKGVKEKAKKMAIRKAIEENAGVVITAQSTMKNMELEEDVVNSYAKVYLKSIKELSYNYDRGKETGIYLGEFVIDIASMAKMVQAQEQLSANKNKPVEASVFLFDGQGRMISDGRVVREGDTFHVMVQPVNDLYAYLINRDTRGNLFNIFPNRNVSPHVNPLQAGVQYYFPPHSGDLIFAFDENPGRDRFYFLFSAVPLNDIDDLFEKLEKVGADEKRNIVPIIQERILTRGIAVKSKSTQALLTSKNGGDGKGEKQVGELLRGTGAFVKMVNINHY